MINYKYPFTLGLLLYGIIGNYGQLADYEIVSVYFDHYYETITGFSGIMIIEKKPLFRRLL